MCLAIDVAHCALYVGEVKTLAEQLNAAFLAKGWTLDRLLAESELEFSRWSLMRKLKGEQKLATDECQKLADVLGVTVAWTPAVLGGGNKSKRRAS